MIPYFLLLFLISNIITVQYHCGENVPVFLEPTYPTPNASCIFNDTILTAETLKNWPSQCEIVCGNISLNSESKFSEEQLKDAFSKLKVLFGTVTLENTNFKSLNFLSPLRVLLYGITLFNNTKLSNIDIIGNFSTTPTVIIKNPKLNFEKFCDRNTDFNVYGNLKDCGCKNVRIDSSSLPFYSNCTNITGVSQSGLKITDINNSFDLSVINRLKSLSQKLEVYETQLEDLSFLGNLETFDTDFGYRIIDIYNNPNLKRLGFDSLKTLAPNKYRPSATFISNHPDFCLTTNELQLLAESKVDFLKCEAKLCMDLYRKDGQKVCYFEYLADMDSDCQHIIGDIIIDSDNEKYVGKLEKVTNIWGSITIQDTEELEDLGFLTKFRQVANLYFDGVQPQEEGVPPVYNLTAMIRIISNKKIEKVWLPSMINPPYPPVAGTHRIIEIRENLMEIFRDRRECLLFQQLTQSMIKYNQHGCAKLEKAVHTSTVAAIPTTTGLLSVNTSGGDAEEESPETAVTDLPNIETTTKLASSWRLSFLLIPVLI